MSKTVSLVLGCGAARGLAHIGVINVLREQGYQINSISGTSMGALVGGLYAADGLDEYTDYVRSFRKVDFFKYLNLSVFSSTGVIKGDLILDTLKSIIGNVNIEELPIPYTAVATDINRGKEVWLQEGRLYDAIRASIAIPGVFSPHKIGHRLLVDGGIVNPVPVMPLSDAEADIVIAVDVNAAQAEIPEQKIHKEPRDVSEYEQKIEAFLESMQKLFNMEDTNTEQQLSVTDVLLKSFTTMQSALARYKLAANQPDVLISIPRNVCEAHEFYRAEEIIKSGAWWAERALETAHFNNKD
jgi:NTE family protein